ncbi:uncharacterized protein LOC127751125 [Frankliniella occidentalis]|uniref:Uncharacterized protein LOC127751125 n=1 Tax=Frankliniella occidentalis TaxID=133901 RepID=A0A9C6XT93_FRAOC|nr:uncharacterized protein LOC127751125 [Frankliniella occidentalis]
MERVEGLSGGRFVFLHLDFIYLLSHIGDVLTHVKCQVGGCQGSAAFSGDNVYPIREHNHGPDLEMLDLIRFKNELRRLARESSEDYRRLYDNASARFRLGARAYAFPAASQMMQRIRRAHVPPTPTDLLNLQETLRHPNWTNWAKDSEGNDFFRESFVAPDGTQCAVFVSHTFSDLVVRPGWRAHADGTFKSIPLNLNLEQLFSLHVIDEDNHGQKKQLYPVAYALMTRRTTDAYEAVLRCICNHVPGIQRPASLMADFEPALRSGFRRVWPEIEVHGCWFHFGQAVLHRAVDECHLKPLLQEAPEAARAQKMLMTLPLLPMELIVAGLEYVENHVARNGLTPQFAALLRYMRTYWINEVGVEILAIGHLHFRTNNAVEAFHKCLNTSVGVHPNFWKFVDALRAVDNSRARDRGQVQNFVQVRRRQRANYRMQDDHIRDSRALYLEGEQPDIGGFLRAACHSMDRYFYRMMLDNRERAGGPAAAPARAAGAAAAPAGAVGAAGPAPAAGPAAEPADAPGAARVPQGPAPGPARGELLPAGPRPRVARGGRRGVARVAAPAAPAAPAVAAAAPAPLAEDSSDDDDFVQPRQRNQARVAHPAGQPADLPAGQPAQPAGQPAQPAGQPAQPAGQPAHCVPVHLHARQVRAPVKVQLK